MISLSESQIKNLKDFRPETCIISIDIGATKTLARKISSSFDLLCEIRIETGTLIPNDPEGFPRRLRSILEENLGFDSTIGVVSVSTAGAVTEDGTLIWSPNLGWKDLPVKTYFEKAFQLPVALINDCDAGALAEKFITPGYANLMYITISSGIGGGLILSNSLYRGENGAAAEIGHLIVEPNGKICSCGRKGCLQAYSSGRSIERDLREIEDDLSKLAGGPLIEEAIRRMKSGDSRMAMVFEDAFKYLGMAIAFISGLLDIGQFRLGGGVMAQSDVIIPIISKWVERFEYPVSGRKIEVRRASSYPDSSIFGAEVNGLIKMYTEGRL